MYILQIYDTFTQEILHQETHENPNEIERLFSGQRIGRNVTSMMIKKGHLTEVMYSILLL